MRGIFRHILVCSVLAEFGITTVQQGVIGNKGVEVFATSGSMHILDQNLITNFHTKLESIQTMPITPKTSPTSANGVFHPFRTLGHIIGGAIHAVSSVIGSITKPVISGIHSTMSRIGTVVGNIAKRINPVTEKFITGVGHIAGQIANGIGALTVTFGSALAPIVQGTARVLAKLGILQIPGEISDLAGTILSQTFHNTVHFMGDIITFGKQIIGDIGEGIEIIAQPFGKIIHVIGSTVAGAAIGAIKGVIAGLKHGIQSLPSYALLDPGSNTIPSTEVIPPQDDTSPAIEIIPDGTGTTTMINPQVSLLS